MILEIDSTRWRNILPLKSLSLFFNPDYLEAVGYAFNVNVRYFIFFEKETVLFASVVFEKNKNIVLPECFTYSPLWMCESLSDYKKVEIQKLFIEILKKQYRKILFKFNIDILDVRPFKWQKFQEQVKYTYIKNTSELPHKSIIKNLKKIDHDLFEFETKVTEISCLAVFMPFFTSLGYSESRWDCCKELFTLWSESGYLRTFNIKKGNQVIASNLVLLDNNMQKAYTIVLNPTDNTEKYIHTYLYQNIIDWLQVNGYTEVDLCGANIEGVASFKSFFLPALKSYYYVSYSSFNPLLNYMGRILNKL